MVTNNRNYSIQPGSFRDPSGFLFRKDNRLFRQINNSFSEHFDHLMESGLYDKLTELNMLISHKEVNIDLSVSDYAYKVIEPDLVEFISYPYEWCFSAFKHAALLTLDIQKIAIKYGMSIKDASAYNIQFVAGSPILIDTLSFEIYDEGKPWFAYKQFCQHFLSPLALMAHVDINLGQLLRLYIDGVPLGLASSLLPFKSYLSWSLLSHVHLHAKSQKVFLDKHVSVNNKKFSRVAFEGIIDSLYMAIKNLKLSQKYSEWSDYYSETKRTYSSSAAICKTNVVQEFIELISPKMIWDLGANDGKYSRLASGNSISTIAFDADHMVVESNYLDCILRKDYSMLPLVMDLSNPSADIGWSNEERMSFLSRSPVDMIMALALVHHLSIANNVPFDRLAKFFAKIGRTLIVEFVPKKDPQVVKLLRSRIDVFHFYSKKNFENEFSNKFEIISEKKIKDSDRTIYLMRNRMDLE